MELGPFAGPIYTIILIVDCLFFLFLEWWMPREDLDYVTHEFRKEAFRQVNLAMTSRISEFTCLQHMNDVQMGSPTSIQEAINKNTIITMEELLKAVNTP
jgi:phosphatidylinositol glycan class A protein